jgi:hypothetical protein
MFMVGRAQQRIIERIFTLFKTRQITMRLYETVLCDYADPAWAAYNWQPVYGIRYVGDIKTDTNFPEE